MIFSLWGFIENAKLNNLNKEGYKELERHIRRMCTLLDIDYDIDIDLQLKQLEEKQ